MRQIIGLFGANIRGIFGLIPAKMFFLLVANVWAKVSTGLN